MKNRLAGRVFALMAACLASSTLSGCIALHVAGDVAEGAVNTTGAVVGAGVDVVTTSDEERAKKADHN